jgi:hypothetical protein
VGAIYWNGTSTVKLNALQVISAVDLTTFSVVRSGKVVTELKVGPLVPPSMYGDKCLGSNAFLPLYVNPCWAGFTEIGAPPGKGLIPVKPYY